MRNYVMCMFWVLFVCLNTEAQEVEGSNNLLKSIKEHHNAVHMMGDTWMRDPYIYLADDGYYYLTCTRQNETLPNNEIAINFWRSKNLVDWKDLGARFKRNDSHWMDDLYNVEQIYGPKEPMIWAPEVYQFNNKWVVVHTTNKKRANLMMSDGTALQAPWKEPIMRDFGHRHDPAIFTDNDGSNWLVYGCAKIIKFKDDFNGFDGEEIEIGPSNRKLGHEGCMIHKMGNKYVLFGTAWTRDKLRSGSYNLYYCVADKLEGPYGPRKFAGRFLGHGTLFKDKKDRWWCTAFLNGTYTNPAKVKANGIPHNKATTINKQGLTLVPVVFKEQGGEIIFYAKDENYRFPGDDEMQKFDLGKLKALE